MRGQYSVLLLPAAMLPSPWWPRRAELHPPIPVIISPPQRSMPRRSLHVLLWRTCIIHDLITASSGDGRRSTLRLMGVWRIMACHCCDFLTMREKESRGRSYQADNTKGKEESPFSTENSRNLCDSGRLAFHRRSICCLFKLVGFQCFSYLWKAKRSVCLCVCLFVRTAAHLRCHLPVSFVSSTHSVYSLTG